MELIIDYLKSLLEPAGIFLALVIFLLLNTWVFKKLKSFKADLNIIKNSISFFIVLFGTVVFILSLPIENVLKGQILTFLGIIISAGIALSSTTLLGNIIAGIMNNSMKRFKVGDLMKIGEHQGRVVKKSIFHTEIQLEDSNFMNIPNLYIASNPVKLTRKTNTVISTTVTLGYDVSRIKIEEALKEAAADTGLKDPYVYITDLGDHSVSYKIHGFLEDSGKFFSTGSLLNGKVLDKLHAKKIEIVSPTFMNQRRVDEQVFIPKEKVDEKPSKYAETPEDKIFDEAILSEELEKKKEVLKKIEEKISSLKAKVKETEDKEEIEKTRSLISRNEKLKERIEASIKEQQEKKDKSDQ